ncbi:uncharacterized protein METZ01_LOCUS233410, partial [marine metagenome]
VRNSWNSTTPLSATEITMDALGATTSWSASTTGRV